MSSIQIPPIDSAAAATPIKSFQSTLSSSFEPSSPSSDIPLALSKALVDFELGRHLGEGSFSTVIQVKHLQSGKFYALKILNKQHIVKEKKVRYVHVEKQVLQLCRESPFIYRLYWTFQDQTNLYFVLELAENGELLSWLKRFGTFSLECTQFYVGQLLCALDFLHSHGILHRDLKPENMLLDGKMNLKLADFGSAKILDDSVEQSTTEESSDREGDPIRKRRCSFVGTAEYVSPELLTEKEATQMSDIWAVGCITFQLLSGKPPFKSTNDYQTFQKITHLRYAIPDFVPEIASKFIKKILIIDPNERLGSSKEKTTGAYAVKKVMADELFSSAEQTLGPISEWWQKMAQQEIDAPTIAPLIDKDTWTREYGGGELNVPSPFVTPVLSPVGSPGDNAMLAQRISQLEINRLPAITEQPRISPPAKGTNQPLKDSWQSFLYPGEKIILSAPVIKRKPFRLPTKRMLILTSHKRLMYIDEKRSQQRGEIPFTREMRIEMRKGYKARFYVFSAGRRWDLEDLSGDGQRWIDEIRLLQNSDDDHDEVGGGGMVHASGKTGHRRVYSETTSNGESSVAASIALSE